MTLIVKDSIRCLNLFKRNGVSQKWNFDGSGSAAEIEEAGTDTTLTGADDFEGDGA